METTMLGKQLKDAREALGLTLEKAADLVGFPKTSLWRYEQQEGKVAVDTFVLIAHKYGLSARELLDDKRVKVPEQIDFERMGIVIEYVETIITKAEIRPAPAKVRLAVTEVLKIETNRLRHADTETLELNQYDELIAGLLRG